MHFLSFELGHLVDLAVLLEVVCKLQKQYFALLLIHNRTSLEKYVCLYLIAFVEEQASDELNKESINRSFFIAESFAKKEYRLITEGRYGDDDDEEELDSPTTASNIDIVYPKGLPTINKLTLIKGIPVLGPLY